MNGNWGQGKENKVGNGRREELSTQIREVGENKQMLKETNLSRSANC